MGRAALGHASWPLLLFVATAAFPRDARVESAPVLTLACGPEADRGRQRSRRKQHARRAGRREGSAEGRANRAALAALVQQAKEAIESLDYEDVLPLAEAIISHPNVDVQTRLDAYWMQGSALTIIGNPVAAERPFRFLLRGRPDFEPSPDVSPRIAAVLRKVQVEERAIAEQTRALRRQRIIRDLALQGSLPEHAAGGQPLALTFGLRDPGRSVEHIELQYRRGGDTAYSSIALQLDEEGLWQGQIGSDWMTSEEPFVLEYYVTTYDNAKQPLLEVASPDDPRHVRVSAGSPERRSFYASPWFWLAVTTASTLVGAVFYYVMQDQRGGPPTTDGWVDVR